MKAILHTIAHRLVSAGLLLSVGLCTICATADDPPRNKRGPKRKLREVRNPALPQPPRCVAHSESARNENAPPARTMPEMFDRMMGNMARNPATGFQDFMKDQEVAALREVELSAEDERRAGRSARDQYLRQAAAKGYRVQDDAAKQAYLRALVTRMAKHMVHRTRYPNIDVTLVSAPIADGQSFPGGYLVFTTALLEEPDEATVAAVVAHELAHLDLGHLNEYAKRDKLAQDIGRPNGSNPQMAFDRFFSQGMALGSIMMNPFRPEHELEADCTATTWMFLEGYDPAALMSFFERLHERRRDQPDTNPFFRFARTHPYSLDRKDHVSRRLAQLRRWKPNLSLGLYADRLRQLNTQRGPAGD